MLMRRSRLVVVTLLLLVGLAWIGQGSGAIAGSAMSGQMMWALIGAVLIVVGLIVGAREVTRRPAA
jgi:hypothetical protein